MRAIPSAACTHMHRTIASSPTVASWAARLVRINRRRTSRILRVHDRPRHTSSVRVFAPTAARSAPRKAPELLVDCSYGTSQTWGSRSGSRSRSQSNAAQVFAMAQKGRGRAQETPSSASEDDYPVAATFADLPADPDPIFPYTPADLAVADPSPDTAFYSSPRFVHHIDESAVARLSGYYASVLGPLRSSPTGSSPDSSPAGVRPVVRVLDLCSSWVSHYPASFVPDAPREEGAAAGAGLADVLCYGIGMNAAELARNPVFRTRSADPSSTDKDGVEGGQGQRWAVHDLNAAPDAFDACLSRLLSSSDPDSVPRLLDATTCTVSIDYLTSPLRVLAAVHAHTHPAGTVHLAISSRCFPTKAVALWLRSDPSTRLAYVADLLLFSGWTGVEVRRLMPDDAVRAGADPLWVVRGRKAG